MSFAEKTQVPVDRSKAEIEKVLSRYGAGQFAYGWDGNRIMVGFQMNNRSIRFVLDQPNRALYSKDKYGYTRSAVAIQKDVDQAQRQKWRALLLVIKAKLEAVESGISEFEEEFLAHIVLPNGQTVGKWLAPQIEKVYENKKMPLLLGSREVEGP